MRVLLWHVHGTWTNAFVQGGHDYLLPVLPDRGSDGRGRARTWQWPVSTVEVAPDGIREAGVDVVVLQRPHEAALLDSWTGLRAGVDLPAVYLEHDCPRGNVPWAEHPIGERSDVPLVHVTHHNSFMWDSGRAPTTVIEHGVPDPGHRWSGDVARVAVVINEPVRRARLAGTDLVLDMAHDLPVDLFGMKASAVADSASSGLTAYDDIPHSTLLDLIARRRAYLHTMRWTSLGLSLIEAMLLGMPVASAATTEAPRALADGAGVVSCDPEELRSTLRAWLADADAADEAGRRAREAALARYGLDRFLADWDRLLKEVTR